MQLDSVAKFVNLILHRESPGYVCDETSAILLQVNVAFVFQDRLAFPYCHEKITSNVFPFLPQAIAVAAWKVIAKI